ncbi:Origin recognition complex subunit 3 [Ceratocystis pirilliformis]|uniref:Origin recognition complex subunit 3 n=1 Tax=Ceratocystis pirilliformis TaxID=259994 RepID=A0ABR3ZBM1_9PEZI
MDPISNEHDDLVAYVFQSDEHTYVFPDDRPVKKRRTGKEAGHESEIPSTAPSSGSFVPLLSGTETPAATALRETLFRKNWGCIDSRITQVLRSANQAMLNQVRDFVKVAATQCGSSHIPAAFVISGPNIASQDLLFEQLSESLTDTLPSRFVRLRSADTGTIKSALKQVVCGVTAGLSNGSAGVAPAEVEVEEEEEELQATQAGDRFLGYDLAALKAYLDAQPRPCEHIFVAFQDGEGFDSGLLSDLITLFSSWRAQIPFTLLFGIATSTEMLQARLLKSTCHMLYGAQFDVVKSITILERVFRVAVASVDVPLRLGPNLLRSFVDRQQDQVAGIQSFIDSLKYAYMCHFYANPLSILLADEEDACGLQPEIIEGIKSMPSFHTYIETLVAQGDLNTAKALLINPEFLRNQTKKWNNLRRSYLRQLLVAVEIACAAEKRTTGYIDVFIELLVDGIGIGPSSPTMVAIKRMNPEAVQNVLAHILTACSTSLATIVDSDTISKLTKIAGQISLLQNITDASKAPFQSPHSSPSKTPRVTAVAQNVQIPHDTTAIAATSRDFTDVINQLCLVLTAMVRDATLKVFDTSNTHTIDATAVVSIFPATKQLLHEAWLYDNRAPHRDVFVPRPRLVFERSLARPQDYLACTCCTGHKKGVPPATCILYQLYLEAGALINVADLWAAFKSALGPQTDERKSLSLFYRGLAELRMLGYIKPSHHTGKYIIIFHHSTLTSRLSAMCFPVENSLAPTQPVAQDPSGSSLFYMCPEKEHHRCRKSQDLSRLPPPQCASQAQTWAKICLPFKHWDQDDEAIQTAYSASSNSSFPHHALFASTLDMPTAESTARIGAVRSKLARDSWHVPFGSQTARSCTASPIDAELPSKYPANIDTCPNDGKLDAPLPVSLYSPGYTDIILDYLQNFRNSTSVPSEKASPPISPLSLPSAPVSHSSFPQSEFTKAAGAVGVDATPKNYSPAVYSSVKCVSSRKTPSDQRPHKPRPKPIYAPALFDYYGIDFFSPEQAAVAIWHYDLHSPPPSKLSSVPNSSAVCNIASGKQP